MGVVSTENPQLPALPPVSAKGLCLPQSPTSPGSQKSTSFLNFFAFHGAEYLAYPFRSDRFFQVRPDRAIVPKSSSLPFLWPILSEGPDHCRHSNRDGLHGHCSGRRV